VVQCRKRGESLKTTAVFENMWNGKYLEDPDKQAELQAIRPTIFAYTQSDIFGKLRPHSQKMLTKAMQTASAKLGDKSFAMSRIAMSLVKEVHMDATCESNSVASVTNTTTATTLRTTLRRFTCGLGHHHPGHSLINLRFRSARRQHRQQADSRAPSERRPHQWRSQTTRPKPKSAAAAKTTTDGRAHNPWNVFQHENRDNGTRVST
jgi:hypothetical protein